MGGLISSERDFDIDPRAVPNIQITAANTIKSSSLEALTTAIKQLQRDEKARPTTPSAFQATGN
jgi:hypothetical protein